MPKRGFTCHACPATHHDLRVQNRALALFANLPLVVPVAVKFREYHHDHHLFLVGGVGLGQGRLVVGEQRAGRLSSCLPASKPG